MSFRRTSALLMPAITIGLTAGAAFAQTNTTELNGSVTDSTGAKLPGATVTILNTGTGETKSMPAKSAGEYVFPQIVPGHYKVTVAHDGFTSREVEIDLLVATPQTLNFKLDVGSAQVVTVEAPVVASTLNQTDATLGKAFDNTQIQTLPYLANNTLSLLALQPGVVSLDASNTGNNGTSTTGDDRPGTINGARQDQTNLTLDGTDNNDTNLGYAFTGILRATRDSIEEFRVTTSGGNADSGRSSGAQVSLQTKSGTNHIHGSGYYYYRDPAMASNQWFNKQTEIAGNTPNIASKVLQDTYGGSLGLPIIKDKLFFFGAYEGYKQATNQVVTATVPLGTGNAADMGTAAGLRNGTVTYLYATNPNKYYTLSSRQIAQMDPNCTAAGGCPQGPGIDPSIIKYYNTAFPASNTTGGDTVNTGGYSFVSPAPVSLITNLGRLDWNINSKQTLFVRGNLQSDNTLNAQVLPGSGPASQLYGNSRGITGGHIWTISNNIINNFRYGFTRQDNALRGAGGNYVSVSAVTTPFPTAASTVFLQDLHNFVDDATIVKGHHTIQFGANERLVYNDRFLTKFLYENATVTASDLGVGGVLGQNTSLDVNYFATMLGVPAAQTSFRSSYNNAITAAAGIISVAQGYANYTVGNNQLTPLPSGTVSTHYYRSFEQEYYAQDQWKITPKLVITAGLRYSFLGVPFETNGQQVRPLTSMRDFLNNRVAAAAAGTNYDPTINIGPGGPANGQPGFWNADKNDLAPRIAFAYSPNSKTSVRGGFALAYDHFGQGAVNVYNDSYSYGLSSSLTRSVQGSIDSVPRFTNQTTVPQSQLKAAPAGGSFPIANTGTGTISQLFDDHLRTPYAETFNLSVQREVRSGLTVTATYTGRLGRHLLLLRDVAEPLNLKDPVSGRDYFTAMAALDKLYDQGVAAASVPTDAYWQNLFPNLTCTVKGVKYNPTQSVYLNMARSNETATLQAIDVLGYLPATTALNCSDPGVTYQRFFDPQYSSLYNQSTIGMSAYNSGQFSLRHTVTRNIIYDFNYTIAHSTDMGSSPERTQGNNIINTFNPSQMNAASDFDTRHAITGDWVASIPFGKGQHWGGNAPRWMEEVLGGWQLTGLIKYSSAFPWSATVGTSGWGTNWQSSSRDIQIAPVGNSGHHTYLTGSTAGSIQGSSVTVSGQTSAANTATTAAAAFRPAYAGESGQRNNLRGDGYFSLDPGISKSFKITEGQSLKLIVEYFNVTNATRFNMPSNTLATFGQYLSSSTALLNSPRQAQIAARYYF